VCIKNILFEARVVVSFHAIMAYRSGHEEYSWLILNLATGCRRVVNIMALIHSQEKWTDVHWRRFWVGCRDGQEFLWKRKCLATVFEIKIIICN